MLIFLPIMQMQLICISTILTYTEHKLIAPSAPLELETEVNSTFCGGSCFGFFGFLRCTSMPFN